MGSGKLKLLQDETREIISEENEKQKMPVILLAEDNKFNQEVAIAFLELKGYSVVVAETGIEAVEYVKNKKFDCVLMDIQMPEMDGIEAAMQIREFEKSTGAHTHIPIIAMTAHAFREERRQFIKAGMDDYISKPFDSKNLFQKIEDCIGNRT